MVSQLVFDLTRAPAFEKEDFLVSAANEAAVDAVQAWPNWPARTLLLLGPAGSGKSHLAAIWATTARASIIGSGAELSPSLWSERDRSVLLEDCDRSGVAEAELFHALNLAEETGGWILITARSAPATWGIGTPDLLSRLRRSTAAILDTPDEELIRAVLIKLFADRQIRTDEGVVTYAARHCERSLEDVNRFVAAVDEEALAANRRITRPLAAATLARLHAQATVDHGPT